MAALGQDPGAAADAASGGGGSAAGAGGSGAPGGGGGGGAAALDAGDAELAWTDRRLSYLYDTAKADMAAGRRPDYWDLMERFGWDARPDVGRALPRLRSKYAAMRRLVERGEDLLGRVLPRARYPYPLLQRVQEALLSFPSHQATAKEVCAAIAADPAYGPHLDRRPQMTDGTRLERWQKQVGRILSGREHCGFVNTGRKKGGVYVYKYDARLDERLGTDEGASERGASATGRGDNGGSSRPSGSGCNFQGDLPPWKAGGGAQGRQPRPCSAQPVPLDSACMEAAALAALEALERGLEVTEDDIVAAAHRGLERT